MRHALSTLIALTAFALACDPPNPGAGDLEPEGASREGAEEAAGEGEVAKEASGEGGALVLGEVTFAQIPGPPAVEGDPTEEDVRAWADAALGGVEALERSPQGPPLAVNWTVRRAEVEGELPRVFAAVQLSTVVGGAPQAYGTSELRMLDPEAPEEAAPEGAARSTRAVLERVVAYAFDELEQDHAVRVATDAQLVELMRADALLVGVAAERALTRVREPILAGQVEGGAGVMRRYLAHDRVKVVLGAASVLVGMKDEGSGAALVEAAARLSRDAELTGYTAALFLLGDLGGDAARAYLDSVCAGHPSEAVRADACAARGGE